MPLRPQDIDVLLDKIPGQLERVLHELVPDEREFRRSIVRVTKRAPPPPEEMVRKYGDSAAGWAFLNLFPRLFFLVTHRAAVEMGAGTRRELEEKLPASKTTRVRVEQALYCTRRMVEALELETGVPLVAEFPAIAESVSPAFWEAWAIEHVGALLEKGILREAEPIDPAEAEREKQELTAKIQRGEIASKARLQETLQRLVYLCQATGDSNRITWEAALKRFKASKVGFDEMKLCGSCRKEMEKEDSISIELAASEVAYLCRPCGFGRIVYLSFPPEDLVPVIEEGAGTGQRIMRLKARKAQERRMMEEAAKALGMARDRAFSREEKGG